MLKPADLRSRRVVDIPAHVPMVRFGMARFCVTCDLLHEQQSCPKCDGQASIDLREMMTAVARLGPYRVEQPEHSDVCKLTFRVSAV